MVRLPRFTGRMPFPQQWRSEGRQQLHHKIFDRHTIRKWLAGGISGHHRGHSKNVLVLTNRSWRTVVSDEDGDTADTIPGTNKSSAAAVHEYVVAPDGVLHVPTATCHLSIHSPELLSDIISATMREAPGIREAQDLVKTEIAGLITAANDSFGDITVRICERRRRHGRGRRGRGQSGNDGSCKNGVCNGNDGHGDGDSLFSSTPFCGGLRRCANVEVNKNHRVVLGEFHSHPRLPELKELVTFFPPSGHDLFQLCLAALNGSHNLSIVVAPEGLYVCQADQKGYLDLYRDIKRFYEQQKNNTSNMLDAITRCRQPKPELILRDGSTPYLVDIFDFSQDIYDHITMSAVMKTNEEKIAQFIENIRERLHIQIDFIPNPP
jgi:hypothetical protein